MNQVEFGLIVPETALDPSRRHLYMADVNRLLDYVKGHYHSAWFIDHLGGDVLEGWTALTYLSALHPEFLWGHSVLSLPFRNPALVAKMAATLQFMSGGRFLLGIGAGGQEAEHLAYGYGFGRGSARVAALDEALHIIKAMWTQDRATFDGHVLSCQGGVVRTQAPASACDHGGCVQTEDAAPDGPARRLVECVLDRHRAISQLRAGV